MAVDYASAVIEYGGGPNTITLLELTKNLLGVVGSSENDELTLYLQMAGEAAERYCDNKLVNQDVRELYPEVKRVTSLRFYPVSELTEVLVDSEDATDSYSVYQTEGLTLLRRESGVEVEGGPKQVEIKYKAGFDPLPAEVGYALARSATDYKKDNPTNPADIKKETVVGVGSIEFDTKSYLTGDYGLLSAETLSVLDKYRRKFA